VKKLLTILLLLSTLIGVGQTGSIKGTIIDKESGETLIGASVFILGTYKGTVTDINGKYKLEGIKQGDYSIKFSFIGYADVIVNGVRVKSGVSTPLNAKLQTRSTSIQEVVIVGEKSLINLEKASSEVKITEEDIKQMNMRDVQEIVSMQAGESNTRWYQCKRF